MAHAADYHWDKLESYTKQAAHTILASSREAALDMHRHFLNSIYHYMRHSGERLEFAAHVAETDELKAFSTGPVLDMFPKLQFTKAQTRWLRVHPEVDLEHGAGVQEMCANYMAQYEHVITNAARRMSRFWIDIMHEGFHGKSVSQA